MKYNSIILPILALFMISACEQPSHIEIPVEKSKLIVNSYIQPGEQVRVYVGKSLPVHDNAPLRYLPNATLEIYEDGMLVEKLDRSNLEGEDYQANHIAETGKNYLIKAWSNGFSVAMGEDMVPVQVPIKKVTLDISDSNFTTDEWGYSNRYLKGQINIHFDDPPGMKNFYEVNLLANYGEDTTGDYYYRDIYFMSDDPEVEYSASGVLLSDELFNGRSYVLTLNVETYGLDPDEPIEVVLRNASEAYYLYHKSYNQYIASNGDPFAEPVKVYNNIEEGYGIVASFSEVSEDLNIR